MALRRILYLGLPLSVYLGMQNGDLKLAVRIFRKVFCLALWVGDLGK